MGRRPIQTRATSSVTGLLASEEISASSHSNLTSFCPPLFSRIHSCQVTPSCTESNCLVPYADFYPHLASARNGDRLLIHERDKLIEEMIVLLEEIALLLEAASVRNTDTLYTTGFSVTQERRTHIRTKLPLGPPADFSVDNLGDQGKAVGSVSTMPGALNHEIHLNRKDPSVEEDWYHKAMYHDATSMVMDKLDPGHIFFRMRHHGAEGPGPWSPITSTTIS